MTKNASNGAILDIRLRRNTYGRKEFGVIKLSGDWPPKKELVDLCESGNFGGFVSSCENTNHITVDVYTD